MECDHRKLGKQATLQQEAWERSQGMQRRAEVNAEKERNWKEQSYLAGIE
jgi:hypothetical protein